MSCESSIMVVDHLHLQERNITAPKLSSLTENGLYEFNFVTIYIMHHISTFALLTTQSPTLQPQEILQPQRREGWMHWQIFHFDYIVSLVVKMLLQNVITGTVIRSASENNHFDENLHQEYRGRAHQSYIT